MTIKGCFFILFFIISLVKPEKNKGKETKKEKMYVHFSMGGCWVAAAGRGGGGGGEALVQSQVSFFLIFFFSRKTR